MLDFARAAGCDPTTLYRWLSAANVQDWQRERVEHAFAKLTASPVADAIVTTVAASAPLFDTAVNPEQLEHLAVELMRCAERIRAAQAALKINDRPAAR